MDASSAPGGNAHSDRNGSVPRSSPTKSRRPRGPAGTGAKPHAGIREQLRSPRFWIVVLSVWLGVLFLEELLLPHPTDRLAVSYSYFKQQVAAGNVADVTGRADTIQGDFKVAVPDPAARRGAAPQKFTKFDTNIPSFADTRALDGLLEAHGVAIDARSLEEPRSIIGDTLFAFGPTLLVIGGLLYVNRRLARGAGGIFGMGRSRARRYDASDAQRAVTFADVAGIDEVENELAEVVSYLKRPEKFQRLGGTMPKGVLLVGPPGTGKTLLARAVAGEAGVPFFSMSGSVFVEMVVGVGASRVRDLFAQARKAAPAIIFVDELDAIARRRGGSQLGGNEEREQTLNQLLVEMDGFDAREAVIVLAATNRADVLDPAVLRPGRFDRHVTVLPPDRAGRAEILKVHTRRVPLAASVDLAAVAAQTPGLVGADLRNLVNEAALLAARKGKDLVGADDFAEAIEKIALGTQRRLTLAPEERRRVAYHEAGHALLGLLQPDGDPPRRVTVVPRGQNLGVTFSVPEDDRYNYGEDYLRARIVSMLGGRAAEQLVYGTGTTGAENDLKQVTEVARGMVTRWGMSREIGLISLDATAEGDFLGQGFNGNGGRRHSEATERAVDAAIRRIVDECYEKALELLGQERVRLDALVEALLREESLDESRIRAVVDLPEPREAAVPAVP